MKKYAFVYETTVLFLLFDCLNLLFFRGDPGFLRCALHPYWIAVFLISSRYGFAPGILVGLVAAAHVVVFSFHGIPTRTGIERLVERGGFLLPVTFVFTGILLGGIREKYRLSEEGKKRALGEREELVSALREKVEAGEKVQRILETRIVGETATVRTLYEAAKRLESADEPDIYAGCLDALTNHLQVGKSSLYLRRGDYLVLQASLGWPKGEAAEGKVRTEESIMSLALEAKKPVTIKDILAKKDSDRFLSQYGRVLAMFPLKDEDGEPIGVVNIEKIDFLLFNTPNLRLMELLVDWTSRALHNRQVCDSALARSIADGEYGIYSYYYFEQALESEFRRAKQFRLPLTVAFLKIDQFGFFDDRTKGLIGRATVALLRRSVADTDMVFRYRFDGTFAVIGPMKSGREVSEALEKVAGQAREVNRVAHLPDAEGIRLRTGYAEASGDTESASSLVAPALKQSGIEKA